MVMMVVALVPVLFHAWPAIVSLVGHGTLLAIVVFVAIGLIVGHLLGGPDPENRAVLALATSARHPAVAIAIAHFGFPGLKLTGAAVLLYLLVSIIATIPYMTWVKRRHRQIGALYERKRRPMHDGRRLPCVTRRPAARDQPGR